MSGGARGDNILLEASNLEIEFHKTHRLYEKYLNWSGFLIPETTYLIPVINSLLFKPFHIIIVV
jgi:hypothetical protein